VNQIKTKIVILAGGESERFGGPKHLSEILGEPIIKRTLRLLLELCSHEITVVTPPSLSTAYAVIESKQIKYLERSGPCLQKLVQIEPLLVSADHYIVLLGDVFFTRRALKSIIENEARQVVFYCRYGPSLINKKNWGEIFGLSFSHSLRDELIEAAGMVNAFFRQGLIPRDAIWEVAKLLGGVPINFLRTHPRLDSYFEINDHTDDVDFPEDVDKIRKSLTLGFEDS
jgi:choline kinase